MNSLSDVRMKQQLQYFECEEMELDFGVLGEITAFVFYRQDSHGDSIGLVAVIVCLGHTSDDVKANGAKGQNVLSFIEEPDRQAIRDRIRDNKIERLENRKLIAGDKDWS